MFKTGLGFGAAIGFIGTLIITITTVLTVLFARAKISKGIQTFKSIVVAFVILSSAQYHQTLSFNCRKERKAFSEKKQSI